MTVDFFSLNFTPAGAAHLIFKVPARVAPGTGLTPDSEVQEYSSVGVSATLVVLIFPDKVPVNAPWGTAEEVQLKVTPVTMSSFPLFLVGNT